MKLISKTLLFTFLLICFSAFVNAATIHGTVYDLSLNYAEGARVEINTTPKQQIIAKDGTYSFDVANGYYKLEAKLMDSGRLIASEEEEFLVRGRGDFIVDFILFPAFEEEDDITQNLDIIFPESNGNGLSFFWVVLIIIAIIIVALLFKYLSNKKDKKNTVQNVSDKKPDESDLDNLIKIIKEQDGRTTQKDIRKQIPLSEAKISLMIAELEHKGIIEKIKKGRGNIIILRKK